VPNQATLDLLGKANRAIFEAEQAIRKEEGEAANQPMYRMRLGLQDVIRLYLANLPVCAAVTATEIKTAVYLKHEMPNVL